MLSWILAGVWWAVATAIVPQMPAPPAAGVAQAPSSTFWIFLKDGRTLPSYGESVVVGDRLVFNLMVRSSPVSPSMQLMSLPVTSVDLDRTAKYGESMHAAFYASTRGEADYAAITAQVAASINQLGQVSDKAKRLEIAEQARQQLLDWSRTHYRYRDGDIRELSKLFGDVISELRAAAGEQTFSFDLVAGGGPASREPLRPDPSLRESITAALTASRVADNGEERVAILRRAAEAMAGDTTAPDLHEEVLRRLDVEIQADAAYAALSQEMTTRADVALRNADVAAAERLRTELAQRDQQLGSVRPQRYQSIAQEIDAKIEATRARRRAIDHYAASRPQLLDYERRIRPALVGLEGLSSVLEYIRDMKYMAYERVAAAETRLRHLEDSAAEISPPADFAGVHATIVSALRMAREACSRRRQADATNVSGTDREASAAAAGALLLYGAAHQDLVQGLYPPK